jgi:hypothetical protein
MKWTGSLRLQAWASSMLCLRLSQGNQIASKGTQGVRIRSKYGQGNRVHRWQIPKNRKNSVLLRLYLLKFAACLFEVDCLLLFGELALECLDLDAAFMMRFFNFEKKLPYGVWKWCRMYFECKKSLFHG